MMGYFGPNSQENPLDSEGWLNTGDLAEINEEGYVKIIGRTKNIIVIKEKILVLNISRISCATFKKFKTLSLLVFIMKTTVCVSLPYTLAKTKVKSTQKM